MEEMPHQPPKQRTRTTDSVLASFAWLTFYYLFFGFTYAPLSVAIIAPLWLAIAFGCYTFIRRQFTMRALFAFVTVEAASISVAIWLVGQAGNSN